MFAQKNPKIATAVINVLKHWVGSQGNPPDNKDIEDVVHLGLSNPALREHTLSLPKTFF